MSAGHAPVGQALRRLRDRTHLTTVLVARLKQKVWPPLDTGAGDLPAGPRDCSVPQFPSKGGVTVR